MALPPRRRRVELAEWFAFLALVFGITMALLTPPFQVADEPGHFLRAYQISEGQLVGLWHDGFGYGNMPVSLVAAGDPFTKLRFYPDVKTSQQEILAAMRQRLDPQNRRLRTFPSALYSPVVYAPQAITIALARSTGAGVLDLMYAGRLAVVLTYAAIGYFSLRMTPILKRPLFLLLMMPMALSLGASLSADAMTISLAVAATVNALRLAVDPERMVTPRRGLALAAVFTAVALCKFIYFPLIVTTFLIPTERFGSTTRRWAWTCAIALIAFGAAMFWARTTPGIRGRIAHRDDVSAPQQFALVEQHPVHYLVVLARTAVHERWMMTTSFVGSLGWMDTFLSPLAVAPYAIALLLACAPSEPKKDELWRVSLMQIILLLAAAALSTAMIVTLQYLFWTSVGWRRVEGMQGRYLIPLAPLLLIAANGMFTKSSLRLGDGKQIDRLNVATIIIAVMMSTYTLLVIYRRYYL
jgi:uncharacterized membrane protein